MPPRPFVLAESTWEDVRATPFEVAILPWGATEAHNRHLPYGTDTIETVAVAMAAAARAWEAGARALVLPAVPFGVNTGQREVPFCLNMNPSTQMALLRDILSSLEQHGVRKPSSPLSRPRWRLIASCWCCFLERVRVLAPGQARSTRKQQLAPSLGAFGVSLHGRHHRGWQQLQLDSPPGRGLSFPSPAPRPWGVFFR